MIIAVGFKVNSERAVQFRKWVNQIAKDYTIKGWVMDDERLKRGTYLTEKYFDEQLERIHVPFLLSYTLIFLSLFKMHIKKAVQLFKRNDI